MPPVRKLAPLPSVSPSTLAKASANRSASASNTSSTTVRPPLSGGSGPSGSDEIERERLRYQARVQNAHMEEDDPLAVYQEFVEWMVKEYSVKAADSVKAQGELGKLLKKATGKFQGDEVYKQDLRYLKLWVLYIAWVQQDLKNRSNKRGPGDKEPPITTALEMYRDLEAGGIGTSFSMLYEEHAKLLEASGGYQEADQIYSRGIERAARPTARLKTRYNEFRARCDSLLSAQKAAGSSSGSSNSIRRVSPSSDATSKSSQHRTASTSGTSTAPTKSTSSSVRHAPPSSIESRYAVMLAPPVPGKRQEKMMFQMALLFSNGMEYSIQEARAMSMGMLGKKWGPPSASEMRPTSTNQAGGLGRPMPVDFNDDGQKNSAKNLGIAAARRRSLMIGGGPEPTMTINTKEALNDVFGMYNSPEKTMKSMLPGSKHAPVKKVEPITPLMAHKPVQSQLRSQANENEKMPLIHDKTPTAAFRPFVDENNQAKRPAGSTFTPFVDFEAKTPAVTPRAVLSLKDSSLAPSSIPRPSENAHTRSAFTPKPTIVPEAVFSKVFTPADKPPPLAPLRDVFTDDHGKPQPRPKPVLTHERARSHHDVPSSTVFELSNSGTDEPVLLPQPALKPFLDENLSNIRTPFKVFSRPGEEEETPAPSGFVSSAITPKPSATFRPLTDKPTFTPYRDEAVPPTTPAPAVTLIPPSGPTFTPYVDPNEDDSIIPPNNDTLLADPEPSITSHTPPWSNSVTEPPAEDEDSHADRVFTNPDDQYTDDYAYDEDGEDGYNNASMIEVDPEVHYEDEEGVGYQEVREAPLGGRFGQFNVMTPITERTYEFTGSTRSAFGFTPSQRLGHIDEDEDASKEGIILGQGRVDENGAIRKAELLAAELKEDEEDDLRRPVSPLRLSDDHPPTPQHKIEPVFVETRKAGGLSLSDSLALTHSFRPQNPCNPFDPAILSSLLSLIPTDAYFHDLRDQEISLLEALQKFTKKAKKGSGDSASSFPITLKGQKFNVYEKLGEGGFGSVFKAQDMGMRLNQSGDDDDDDDDDNLDDNDDDENTSVVALKVVKPRNIWEYHILRRLHSSLPHNLRPSLVLPHALYAFRDESFLVLELCPQGMLLTIINNALSAGVSQQGACLDELLVMFFTIELLRLIEAMHNAGFIHGDLKIDNCLLRLEDVPGGSSAWSSQYQPSGEGGWKLKGLKLIDFGRTVDTKLFPSGHQFIAEWDADERDCFEIREGQSWTYQTDYFGLAGIVYCMLFGKYIQATSVVSTAEPRHHKIGTPFKRYWQKDLWSRLFDLLLNPCSVHSDGSLPISNELAIVRKEMEVWLQANCNRTSNTLKGLLKKVEMSCYAR